MCSNEASMEVSVKKKFETYPDTVAASLIQLRQLIFSTAKQEGIASLGECLKWNEPSYISPYGTTIRFDWKAKAPEQYCIYFNCKTTLIETVKEVYGDTFTYEGNRALVFQLTESLPTKALTHCLSMALRYKKLKHLPLLGA